MRTKNIKKKIICLFLSAMLGIEPCFAAGIRFTNIKQGGNNNQGEEKDPYTQTDWKIYESGEKTYQYSYKYDINSSTTISVNAYNLDGTSVIPKSTKINRDEFTFKAGTWVGINVSEHKSVSWTIKELEYQEVTKTTEYICHYIEKGHYDKNDIRETGSSVPESVCKGMGSMEKWIPLYPGATRGRCFYHGYDKGGDKLSIPRTKCPKTYKTYYELTKQEPKEVISKSTDIPEDIKKEMKDLAIKEITKKAEAIVKNTSGSVQYMTNNSYPKNKEDTTYGYINEGKLVDNNQKDPEPQEKDGIITGSLMRQYEFLQSKVCMNLKTSKVSYGRDCNEEAGEISIANGMIYDKHLKANVNYWHYFIPLNTTSDSEFTLDIIKNENQKFDINTCKNFMEENLETYQDLIIPSGDFGTFVGDYGRYVDKNLSTDLKKLNDAKGCNISTKIKFPISQEFYNEVTKTTTQNNTELKLQGFNFYYKPIDINNPFPNGFATTSIWQDIDKDNLNLSKSFEEKTYETTKINANKIREYNKDNPYTDWSKMYTTGISSFIENEKIVTRLVKNNSFYKLGCGPANENQYLDATKKVNNIKYIERCDVS